MKKIIQHRYYAPVLTGLLVISLGYIVNTKMLQNDHVARGLHTENTILDKTKVDDGYLLFSPVTIQNLNTGNGKVYLTDLNGKTVHSWKTTSPTLFSIAMPDGSLYAAEITPTDLSKLIGGGKTGMIEKLDKDSKVLWQFKDEMIHHDIDVDTNTHSIFATRYSKLPEGFANRIKGGKTEQEEKDSWADEIIQIDENTGKVVWSWKMSDHLKPEDFVLNSFTPRSEWSHSNSVKYYSTNPINGKPALVLSSRHLSTVFIIDKETGNVLWKSPVDVFTFQHDATLTDKGTILAYDNGLFRNQKVPGLFSRIVEINPLTNKIVWMFDNGSSSFDKAALADSIISGTQRLPNGNTLGIDGLRGHIFEVTPDHKVVFSFVNPYLVEQSQDKSAFRSNTIFKARKYTKDYFTVSL